MRKTSVYDIPTLDILPGRRRLLEAHKLKGSWQRVANDMKINWRYVWDFAVNGKLPNNPAKRKKLLGRKTINDHLSKDNIQNMPIPLLEWAFNNRVEM